MEKFNRAWPLMHLVMRYAQTFISQKCLKARAAIGIIQSGNYSVACCCRKDVSRFPPAVVSVTALRDAQKAIIGYLQFGDRETCIRSPTLEIRYERRSP